MAIEIYDSGNNYGTATEFEISVSLPAAALLITTHVCNYQAQPVTLDGVSSQTTTLVENRFLPGTLDQGRICYIYDYPPGTYDLKFETAYTGSSIYAYAIVTGIAPPLDTDADSGNLCSGTVDVPPGGIAIAAWMGNNSSGGINGDTAIEQRAWPAAGIEVQIEYTIQTTASGITIAETGNYDGSIGVVGFGSSGIGGMQPVFF